MGRYDQAFPGNGARFWDRFSPFVQIVFKVLLGIILSGALAFCLWVTKEIYRLSEGQARAEVRTYFLIDWTKNYDAKFDAFRAEVREEFRARRP